MAKLRKRFGRFIKLAKDDDACKEDPRDPTYKSTSSGSRGQTSSGGRGQTSRGGRGQTSRGGRGQTSRGGRGQTSRGGRTQTSRGGRSQTSRGGRGLISRGGRGQTSRGGRSQISRGGRSQTSRGGRGQTSRGGRSQTSRGGRGQTSRGGRGAPREASNLSATNRTPDAAPTAGTSRGVMERTTGRSNTPKRGVSSEVVSPGSTTTAAIAAEAPVNPGGQPSPSNHKEPVSQTPAASLPQEAISALQNPMATTASPETAPIQAQETPSPASTPPQTSTSTVVSKPASTPNQRTTPYIQTPSQPSQQSGFFSSGNEVVHLANNQGGNLVPNPPYIPPVPQQPPIPPPQVAPMQLAQGQTGIREFFGPYATFSGNNFTFNFYNAPDMRPGN